MQSLMLSRLDKDNLIHNLCTGEHIIGRGPLLQCTSKKVSRNHGIIKVLKNDGAVLTSTHTNPCFHLSHASKHMTVVRNGMTVKICNGDRIALLPEEYWFQVQFVDTFDNNNASKISNEKFANTTDITIQNETISINLKRTNENPIEEISRKKIKNEAKIDEDKDFRSATTDLLNIGNEENVCINEEKNIEPKVCNNEEKNSEAEMDVKSSENEEEEIEFSSQNSKSKETNNEVKHVQSNDNEEEEIVFNSRSSSPDLLLNEEKNNEANNTKQITSNDDVEEEIDFSSRSSSPDLLQNEETNNEANSTKQVKSNENKEEIEFYSRSSSPDLLQYEETNNTKQVKSNENKEEEIEFNSRNSSPDLLQNEDANNTKQVKSNENEEEIEFKSQSSSPDLLQNEETNNEARELEEPASSNVSKKNIEINVNQNEDGNMECQNNVSSENDDPSKNVASSLSTVKVEPTDTVDDPNQPSTSGNTSVRRDRCWYGQQCYRKNLQHKTEFSHPGDDDYASDPNDDRPVCGYGANCYRKNKLHRQHFRHPNQGTSQARKPPDQKQKPPTKRKRTPKKANTKVTSDNEDDYDYSDPFIDDGSSDEYHTESEYSESDEDYSNEVEEESQENRQLLKEAKRFTRKNKKKD